MSIEHLLIAFVIIALSLIALGIYNDRKKITKEVVNMTMHPKRHMVRCVNCKAWTSLESSDNFDGIGMVCSNCSKQLLTKSKIIEYQQVIQKPKKRGFIMSMIKGSNDEY